MRVLRLTIAEDFIGFASLGQLEVGRGYLFRLLSLRVIGQSQHAETLRNFQVGGILRNTQDVIVILSHIYILLFLIIKWIMYYSYS